MSDDLVRVMRDTDPDRVGHVQVVTLDQFADTDEQGAAAIVGSRDSALIPEGSTVMFYGDGGVGKTTLAIDLAFHLAAGDEWLGIAVAQAVRVLLVENEGARPLFRRKLQRKRDAWAGSDLGDRLRVLEHPWARFTFAEASWRDRLADELRRWQVDVVIIGPLASSGMERPGTLQEVREFERLVQQVREAVGRPVVVVLIHHENRAGQVSGSWEGIGETLLHVTQQGHGHLRLHVQKARGSSEHHNTTMQLAWAEGDGFAIEDKPELDDDTIAERIVAAVAGDPGLGWTRVTEQTPGVGRGPRKAVRDGLLRAGTIVNVAKNEQGEQVLFDHVPERRPSSLYLADDPTIRHLRPESGADGAQTAPPWGERGKAAAPSPLRPEGAWGAAAQPFTPSLDLGDDAFSDNSDSADDRQRCVQTGCHEPRLAGSFYCAAHAGTNANAAERQKGPMHDEHDH